MEILKKSCSTIMKTRLSEETVYSLTELQEKESHELMKDQISNFNYLQLYNLF
jgi:hypothetical protein